MKQNKLKKMSIVKFKSLIDELFYKPDFCWELNTDFVRLVTKVNTYVFFGTSRQHAKLYLYLIKLENEKALNGLQKSK